MNSGTLTLSEQHELLRTKTRGLIYRILRRKLWWLDPQEAEEVVAEGWAAACRAAATYRDEGFAWSTYANTVIERDMIRCANRNIRPGLGIPFSCLSGADNSFGHGENKSRLDRVAMRRPSDMRAPGRGRCFGCDKPFSEDLRAKSRNLCPTCDRARTRAKSRFGGEGICECGRILRSRPRRLLLGRGRKLAGPRFYTLHCECGDPVVAQGEVMPFRVRTGDCS